METPIHVITSSNTDPFINCGYEEFLFRSMDDNDIILYLYRNAASIVIGRSQNPWRECLVNELERKNIFLLRRCSGGGTVYHDSGNLNLSLMCKKSRFSAEILPEAIKKALHRQKISVERNERNDLLINREKVSGGAFRHAKGKVYHHCTLLVNADLAAIRNLLKPCFPGIEAKGVTSVRSAVTNIYDHTTFFNPDNFLKDLVNILSGGKMDHAVSTRVNPQKEKSKEMKAIVKMLKSEEWIFGTTPPFSVTLPGKTRLIIRKGTITDILYPQKGPAPVSLETKENRHGKAADEAVNYSSLTGTPFSVKTARELSLI